ncbi:MAG TPA: RodZ domain-containing protein [Vicinamibacterales bacterium]
MNEGPGTFDEAKALERLEHLHAQILRAQEARRRVEAEFDAFVMGFKRDQQPADIPPAECPAATIPETTLPATIVEAATPAPVVQQPPASPAIEERVAPAPPVPSTTAPRRRSLAVPVTLVAVILVGVLAFALRSRDRAPAAPPAQPAERPAATAAETPPAAAPVPAPAPSGVNLEMVTRRPVWVRVTIDGQRAIERELPADQRIPLHGEKTIVIRAGDAGAVILMQDGRDTRPLGRDGMPATREFRAAADR